MCILRQEEISSEKNWQIGISASIDADQPAILCIAARVASVCLHVFWTVYRT